MRRRSALPAASSAVSHQNVTPLHPSQQEQEQPFSISYQQFSISQQEQQYPPQFSISSSNFLSYISSLSNPTTPFLRILLSSTWQLVQQHHHAAASHGTGCDVVNTAQTSRPCNKLG